MKVIVYATVAAVAAAAGFGIYRYAIEPRIAAAPTPVAAAPLEPASEEAPPPIPTVLPDFSLQDREGTKRSVRSWPQKSMIVNFWATWCAPCRREIPLLKELQKNHAAEGFQVVGVAVDFRDAVLDYANEIGIDYPLLIGEEDGLEAVISLGIGSIGFPFTVFTDNQQRIVATHMGELKASQADVIVGAVNQVNSGELTVESARTVVAKQLAELEPAEGESAPGA
jgi:thiol-disulfide isomerase/thioredoxin